MAEHAPIAVAVPTPTKRFGTRAVLAALALIVVTVPFGLLLLFVRAKWAPLLRLDYGVRDDVYRFAVRHAWFVRAMKSVSTVGSSPVYLLVFAVVVIWLLLRRLRRLAAFVVVTVVGSVVLNTVAKAAVARARPVLPVPIVTASGQSFPSGHAQAAIVTYAVLLLVFLPALRGAWRYLAYIAATVMVAAIGFSRIALGVHFLSDVLAAYLLGAAWVMAMTAVFSAWRHEIGRPPVHPAEGLEPEHADQLTPSTQRTA
jgi:undecaprenyl-diphosphatase